MQKRRLAAFKYDEKFHFNSFLGEQKGFARDARSNHSNTVCCGSVEVAFLSTPSLVFIIFVRFSLKLALDLLKFRFRPKSTKCQRSKPSQNSKFSGWIGNLLPLNLCFWRNTRALLQKKIVLFYLVRAAIRFYYNRWATVLPSLFIKRAAFLFRFLLKSAL